MGRRLGSDSLLTINYAVEESAENARSFPKNVMSDTGQRGRLLHNEQFAPFYGSVAFGNAPNLHAGSSQAEMRKDRRLRCSLFLPLLAFLVFHLSDQAGALERQKKYQEDIFISK